MWQEIRSVSQTKKLIGAAYKIFSCVLFLNTSSASPHTYVKVHFFILLFFCNCMLVKWFTTSAVTQMIYVKGNLYIMQAAFSTITRLFNKIVSVALQYPYRLKQHKKQIKIKKIIEKSIWFGLPYFHELFRIFSGSSFNFTFLVLSTNLQNLIK